MTALDYLRTLTPRVAVWREDGPDAEWASAEEAAYTAAIVTCPECGETWHPESEEPYSSWAGFHAQCKPAPCDHCGQLTNTPEACFTCYHEPFGIGWQNDNGF
jgi:phage terminase large subunit GpA-like protein